MDTRDTRAEADLLRLYRAANEVQIETCTELIHSFAFGLRHGFTLHTHLRDAVRAVVGAATRYQGTPIKPAKTPLLTFDEMFDFLFGSEGAAVTASVERLARVATLLDGLADDRVTARGVLLESGLDAGDVEAMITETLLEPQIAAAVDRLRWACGRFLEAESKT